MNVWGHPNRGIPLLPKALSLAGLLPLVTGAALLLPSMQNISAQLGLNHASIIMICGAYAGMIVAFLGGIHWGVALNMSKAPSHRSSAVSSNALFIWSNVVALTGCLAFFDMRLAILALLVQWAMDAWLTQQSLVPHWWLKLRSIVSPIAIVSIFFISHSESLLK